MSSSNDTSSDTGSKRIASKQRRTAIPERPNSSMSLWSIMKNCIGKELTKIPMPVNFNEPISVLQRITEDLEYSSLLDQAVNKTSLEQLCYITAFAVSCYSTTGNRTTKPFNPILGETYECDRSQDMGWRSIAEQVSHHPPAAAHHVEGNGWTMYQDFSLTSRFRGKYLSVTPTGMTYIQFKNQASLFSFKKITTTVHNIIVGKLWIDNHGDMVVENHQTGEKCYLKFHEYSYFSAKPRKVSGTVKDSQGNIRYAIQGFWDKYVEYMEVDNKHVGAPKRLWTINPPYPNCEKMYFFTKFTIELNEEDDSVAPTDSRRRPDQRLMENGAWDEANKVKTEIEDHQRQIRRKRETEHEEYTPKWFEKTQDNVTGGIMHKYKNEYWECKEKGDWSRCPSIFSTKNSSD